jgi:hypothetical protein
MYTAKQNYVPYDKPYACRKCGGSKCYTSRSSTTGYQWRVCVPCHSQRMKRTFIRLVDSDKYRLQARRSVLTKYGLSISDYERLLELQCGVCAICEMPEKKLHRRTGEIRRLSVDHDHTTGKVRGLLCAACNLAIGNIRDNPNTAVRMAEYLTTDERILAPNV